MTTHSTFELSQKDIDALTRTAHIMREIERHTHYNYWTCEDLEHICALATLTGLPYPHVNKLNATRSFTANDFSIEIPREEQNA